MEKLIQRALWLKYEYQIKEAEMSKSGDLETGHLLSRAGLNNFLQYFSTLSQRDPENFKSVVAENCEIKTIKKMNALSQDQAVIRLKEPTFNDLKKQILKERGSIKQFSKLFDFANDKILKA